MSRDFCTVRQRKAWSILLSILDLTWLFWDGSILGLLRSFEVCQPPGNADVRMDQADCSSATRAIASATRQCDIYHLDTRSDFTGRIGVNLGQKDKLYHAEL